MLLYSVGRCHQITAIFMVCRVQKQITVVWDPPKWDFLQWFTFLPIFLTWSNIWGTMYEYQYPVVYFTGGMDYSIWTHTSSLSCIRRTILLIHTHFNNRWITRSLLVFLYLHNVVIMFSLKLRMNAIRLIHGILVERSVPISGVNMGS